MINKFFYAVKPCVPRKWQLYLRKRMVFFKRDKYLDTWPIDPASGKPPQGWTGWPEGKQFALVLTHDVETAEGVNRCRRLAEMEMRLGFRSSFNFVPGDYPVPGDLLQYLRDHGFEIGVHGLHHHKNPFRSSRVFEKQAPGINQYLKEWGAVGFRAPSMYHDLDLVQGLSIEYDASTFDTDPFEPQPDGMGTIFPFRVPGTGNQKGYVELPYTLPQDFLLFILMEEKTIDIWKRKLDWIAEKSGMALFITHPNYMSFDASPNFEEYPAAYYEEFLEYIKSWYESLYWNALPKDTARFWNSRYRSPANAAKGHPSPRQPLRVCMLAYSFYESDGRIRRYAETLAKRGDIVEAIALRKEGQPDYEVIEGVHVYRIQERVIDEKGEFSYLFKLVKFFILSMFFATRRHLKNPYHLIHVHSVPDFEVFAVLIPKLLGAKTVLDIHDIVPEFYAAKFHKTQDSLLFKLLAGIERASIAFSDHVIISNHLWGKTLVARSVSEQKCSVVMNYPDESIFYKRPRERFNGRFIMIYPGTLNQHQGLDIAIRAFALIQDQALEAEFHIYGRGPEKINLEGLIAELGLGDRVFIKETVPIEQIAGIMANADLGVIPKRNDPFGGEAFSTKILEFMSLGIPAVVSRTKIDDYYFNDSVVQFFDPDDERDLARCMLLLIKNDELRNSLTQKASAFVEQYSWQAKKQIYLDIVDKLVGKRG